MPEKIDFLQNNKDILDCIIIKFYKHFVLVCRMFKCFKYAFMTECAIK